MSHATLTLGFVDKVLAKKFGRVLSHYRIESGISQQALAADCELDRTFISMLENGRRQPSLTTIFRLAQALSVKPQTLVAAMDDRT